MMRFIKYKLEDVCDIQIGKTPRREVDKYWGKGYSWVSISDMKSKLITSTKEEITEIAIKECGCKLIPKGTLLMSFKLSIGKLAFAGNDLYTNEAIVGLKIKNQLKLYPGYLFYVLKFIPLIGSNNAAMGSTLNKESLRILQLPIPEKIEDQIHITNLLSKAEDLINQRKESICLLDEFLKSTFIELFGDPGINKKKYKKLTLKELSLRFSDGPFGSNLKTEHYSEKGVQVIRLQNIGINKFIENDINFVDETHYENVLKKYSCYPNDVVIATMGSPNVRACVVPKYLKVAINKADCVLFRVNPKLANHFYISHLLNQEGFLFLATSFIHGQTRARISSGQLAKISIPVPPLELQTQFAQIVEKTDAIKAQYQSSLQELENLYSSLSQRAFKGELTLKKENEMMMAAETLAEYNLKSNFK